MIGYNTYMINKKGEVMLGVNEICTRFYVTPQTVYRWKKEGAPIDKIGRKLICNDYEALKLWWSDHYEKEGK